MGFCMLETEVMTQVVAVCRVLWSLFAVMAKVWYTAYSRQFGSTTAQRHFEIRYRVLLQSLVSYILQKSQIHVDGCMIQPGYFSKVDLK
jgi:hypothetical protein